MKDALSDWRADGVTESDYEFTSTRQEVDTIRINRSHDETEGFEEEDDYG